MLALQRGAGNRAVTRLLQRDTYAETAEKLGALDVMYNFLRKREGVLALLKPYAKAIETRDSPSAYGIAKKVTHAIQTFKVDLETILRKSDGKVEALKSLDWWLEQIARDGPSLEDEGKAGLILADRTAGRLLYGEPPLKLVDGEKLMDGLRRGEQPAGAGLKIGGEMAEALKQDPARREWGLGTLSADPASEAVIIAGRADATPFPDFPYLTARAHTHPVKPHLKQKAVAHRYRPTPALYREGETPLAKAFEDHSIFGIDLMPSTADIVQAGERGVPQTVFVNYRFSRDDATVVNPDVPNEKRDVKALPWIDFVIADVRSAGTGSAQLFSLALVAGETRLDFKDLRTDKGPWMTQSS